MKKFIKPIILVIIYFIMQGVAGAIIGGIALVTNPDAANAIQIGDANALTKIIPASWLAFSVIVSGILTVLIAWAMKLISWKTVIRFDRQQASSAWLPIIAAIAGIFAIIVLEEQLQLTDILQNEFADMMHSALGVLMICVVGPIVEELCFREAIMGSLIRKGTRPWVAILFSAVIFGLIHANPVQIVGAGLMGIIFGIIYYKSGNIVLTTLLHILNNSFATISALVFGKDATMSDLIGGSTVAIVSGIICTIFCIAMLIRYWTHTK